jgi:hypothetical protein
MSNLRGILSFYCVNPRPRRISAALEIVVPSQRCFDQSEGARSHDSSLNGSTLPNHTRLSRLGKNQYNTLCV